MSWQRFVWERVKEAKNIIVFCDLNFRSKLWCAEKVQKTMPKIMRFVDVCIANEEDAEKALGIKARNTGISSGLLDKEEYQRIVEKICNTYGCKYVAVSLRKSFSANHNCWSGMFYEKRKRTIIFLNEYDIQVIDKLRAGDSFATVVIFGLLK